MSERIVYGDRESVVRIAVALKRVPNLQTDAVIARYIDDELAGGCVYSDYTRESVVVHVAGFKPGWVSRLFLYMAFDYPFSQMKVARIFAQIPETNLVSLGFNKKLGFSPVAYIPGVFEGNVAMVVTRLERDDCRWLKLADYYRREHPDVQRQ
jgi:RimJ/RimL family protein N-acetyltransferase